MTAYAWAMGALLLPLGFAACAFRAPGADRPAYSVVVEAGGHARRATPVSFDMPADAARSPHHLRAPDGRVLPLQVDGAGRASFLLEALGAEEEVRFTLEPGAVAAVGVEARQEDGAVTLLVAGSPLLRYNAEVTEPPRPDIDPVYARGGYIHPVRTPEGVVVSGDYPPDHLHHHGIWAAWTRTRFEGDSVDFWNVAERRGDVLPVGIDSTWSGPVHGGFTAQHRYVALTGDEPRDALRERWTVRAYGLEGAERPYRVFDLEVEQTTATSEPLVLPEYHYGGVAYRGRDDWFEAENASFLTSEGREREDGNETRARWTHIGGLAEGAARGVAVLSHPDNFRHPEPVRIHPREPYFVWTPSQLGEWSIEAGEPHRVRYRYVVHDGGADPQELDRIWNDFANPPEVRVEPL